MKKSIIMTVATIMIALTTKGQIALENTYAIPNTTKKSGLSLIKLDVSGQKYCLYDIQSKKITLYNLNHSVFKTINFVPLTKYRTSNTDSTTQIAYISENLFNNDNLVELVTFDGDWSSQVSGGSLSSMNIFNEVGSVLFSGDSLMPCRLGDATNYGVENGEFIYNTTAGTKMILYSYKNNTPAQRVYSLPGVLVTSIKKNNENYNNALPFPNPTNNSITLPYKLDSGKEGKLVINDINGKILFEYKIDTTFDNVLIDTNTMTAGNYFYSIFSSDKKVSTGKFIVTK
jgi:hypothetical protein